LKAQLDLERHGGRKPAGVCARVLQRLLALTAAIWHNETTGHAALDGGLIFQHAKAADGIYQAALRAELTRRLGVAWEHRDEQWEIRGVPPGLCRRWSTRRSQITAALAAYGLDPDTDTGRAAQTAALATRHGKVHVGDGRPLHDRFAREAVVAGHDPRSVFEAAVPSRLQQRRQQHTQSIEPGRQLLDAVTGPEGVTQRASSFSRRDAVIDLTTRSAILSTNAADVALRTEALLQHLLRDQRVVPVLAPGPRTSSEILRVRDASGRIVRTVDQSERRYTTVDLLTAETELLHRATSRQDAGVALVPRHIVYQVLAVNPTLDADQEAMVRTIASSGAGVDVVVGKAGTGKSTALGTYRAALDAAGIPVVGVAPFATAAHQLAISAGITDTATVDRLLVELDHRRRTLPRGAVVILDEAAMCPTRTRLALQRAVDAVDGKVVDVGDHRQIPSVDVGGGHHAPHNGSGRACSVKITGSATRCTAMPPSCSATDRPPPRSRCSACKGGVRSSHDAGRGVGGMVDDWLSLREGADRC
jgi:AAA domain/TrwC relaxase